jgi:hypothetical protein
MANHFRAKQKPLLSTAALLLVALLSIVPQALTPAASLASDCTGTPVIESFSVSPAAVQLGQTATLTWGMVYGATAAYLITPSQKTGVATPGQMTVQPDQTTTYTLQAVCSGTKAEAQVTVSVSVPACSGTPSVSSFTAQPMIIQPGQTSTLSWGLVANADSAVLTTPQGKTGVGTPGQMVVNPGQSTTYTLTGSCGNSVASRYVTVAVEGPQNCSGTPTIASFTPNPSVIQKGQSSTLQYGQVSNASGAFLGGPAGIIGVATPGQTIVQPSQTATYVLYALCGSTTLQKQVTVTVQ